MAGGPYKNKGAKNYHIKWSDKKGHPKTPKKTESLRTDKLSIAKARKNKLETLYDEGKHNPWVIPWHENKYIKSLIYGSLFNSGVKLSDIPPPSNNSIPTLLEASEIFISHKTPDNPSKKQTHQWNLSNTARNESSLIRRFTGFAGPGLPINTIKDQHLQSFVQQKGINSDHTVADYIRSLNTFFNFCIKKHGWLTENEKPTYNAPKPQADIPVFIYNDDLYKICKYKLEKVISQIESGDGYPHKDNSHLYMPLAWILLRYTGMRPIELQKLYLDAIDLSHREITVGKPIAGRTNRTKTAVQRKIPMNDIVYEICKLVKNEDFRNKDRWMKKNDHIFGRPGKQSKKRLSSEFTKARKKIIPKRNEVTEYCLRDTFAVWKLTGSETKNPMLAFKMLQKVMGHKRLETTDKYLKALPNRFHYQRLQNAKIFCKIIRQFH